MAAAPSGSTAPIAKPSVPRWESTRVKKRLKNLRLSYTGPSLEILGSDILYLICEILAEPPPPTSSEFEPSYERRVRKHSLAALSATSKTLREITKPTLFSEVIIRVGYWGGGGEWDVAARQLEKLCGPDAEILSFVKIFEFSLRVYGAQADLPAPPQMVYQLAYTLQCLPKLQVLNLIIPEYQADVFSHALQSTKLPKVEKLFLGAYNEFVIPLCPNVHTIWTEKRFGEARRKRQGVDENLHAMLLIDAVVKAETVQELKISSRWTVQMANALAAAKPNHIQRLSEVYIFRDQEDLTDYLQPLSRLPNLQLLVISLARYLNVDYKAPCYGARGMHEATIQKEEAAQERVVRMVEEIFEEKKLAKLWITHEYSKELALYERELIRNDGGKEEKSEERKFGNWVRIERR